MGYTPGPWTWRNPVWLAAGDRGSGVSVLYHDADWPLSDGDASLIEAAPDLLEAAKGALGWLEMIEGDDVEAAEKLLRAAIERAEG